MAEASTQTAVTFPGPSGQAHGHLSRPQTTEARPAVVVIQEWWGLDDHIKDVTRRFAEAGFVALAPDLYDGKATSEPNVAQKLMMELDKPRAVQTVLAAVRWLKDQPFSKGKKVGTGGYCLGGGLSLQAAIAGGRDVNAAVIYYGRNPDPVEQVSKVACPVLGIYGGADQGIPPSEVERLAAAMKQAGKPFLYKVYEGAPHAFFNDTRRESYKPADSADAWARTLGFFFGALNA